MKRFFYLIAICVVMAAVSGCYRHRYPYDKLEEADRLMEERYDSSWAILNAIDTAAISSEANRAYFAMLYAQCQYKVYIYETDDSLISTAIDYYTRHDDRDKLMRSYYYRGIIHMTNNAYAKSISDVVMAERLARRLKDTLFMARTNETLADLYNRAFNMKEAVNKRKMALEFYKTVPGKERNVLFCTADLAGHLCSEENAKRSLNILDSLLAVVPETDTVLLSYIYGTYVFSYFYDKKPEKAVDAFYKLKRLSPDSYATYAPIPKIAENFMKNSQNDSASFYLDVYSRERNSFDDELYYRVRYELAKQAGIYDTALENMESMFTIGNDKIGKMLSDNIAVVEKNAIARENEDNLNKVSKLSSVVKFFLLILVIIVLCVILLRMKIVYQRRELEEKLYAVNQLSKEIRGMEADMGKLNEELRTKTEAEEYKADKEKQISHQNKLLESALENHIEMLDEMSSEYFDKKDAELPTRASMLKTIEKEIVKLSNTSSIGRFKEIVNSSQDNILTEISEEVPNLSETDMTFLTLKLSGFSAKSICLVMDWQLGNYYNRRTRIKNKITSSGAKHTKKFLDALEMKRATK